MSWTNSLLAFGRDERVILVTIGLATFGIVSAMFTALEAIRDDCEIPPVEPKTQYITQETEDALKLDTLDKLMDHPTFAIKETSIKILCGRAINDPDTVRCLLYGITRPNYEERMKCLRALALLTGQTSGTDGLCMLNTSEAYSALVRSLELCLIDADRPQLNDPYWDEYYLRDMGERFCLMFSLELANKYGANMLVKAGFVQKWLAKQDWGQEPEERRRNFKEYTHLKSNRVVEIVNRVKQCRRGLQALSRAGLMDEENSRRGIRELPDLIMEAEPASMLGPSPEQQVPRAREHSEEEQRLRRQHREAMVLNDGTRPLGRDDIIERDRDFALLG